MFEELCEWAARYHAHEHAGASSSPRSRSSRSRSRSLSPASSPMRAVSPRRSRSRSPSSRSRSRSPEESRVRRPPGLRLEPAQSTLHEAEGTTTLTSEELRERRRIQRLSDRRRGRTRRAREHQRTAARGSTPLLAGHEHSIARTESLSSSASSFSSSPSGSDEEPFLVFYEDTNSQREGMSRSAAAEARRSARRSHPSVQWKGADFSDWPPSGRVDPVAATERWQPCT